MFIFERMCNRPRAIVHCTRMHVGCWLHGSLPDCECALRVCRYNTCECVSSCAYITVLVLSAAFPYSSVTVAGLSTGSV